MKKILLSFFALLLIAGCGGAQNREEAVDKELRRDIAQMLMVGFRGTTLDDDNHIVRDIRDYGIGGVILFEYDVPSKSRPRNISSREQLRQLCGELQGLSEETLLIGIDQEGGRVTRLKQEYGFPYFASPQKMAEGGEDSVEYYARLTAETLEGLGINVDFAPCVDVNVNPDCPIIGKLGRSFSSDAEVVRDHAMTWVFELQERGVAACLKHFPGHGSSSSDTHLGVADVSDSWQESELFPYSNLIDWGGVKMIMTTHVFNARFDSVWPATLSHATLTGLLRDSLHFNGVIITDDMAMGAMTQRYGYEEMIFKAIEAGADMLCLSNNGAEYDADIVPRTVDLIYSMVKDGRLSRERIRESAERVRFLKWGMKADN